LADDEGVAGGLYDFAGHGRQLVDVEDPGDLREEALDEAESRRVAHGHLPRADGQRCAPAFLVADLASR
jgi:hypothetical protein